MKHAISAVMMLFAIVVAAGVSNASCSSSTSPTPSIVRITITSSSDVMTIPVAETFSATVTKSDGTTAALGAGAVWSTDAPATTTIGASTGLVTSIAPGLSTIFVDYQGVRGQKTIRVVPSYQGIWNGRYTATGCTGGLQNTCGGTSFFQPGFIGTIKLSLTQSGADITGTVTLDNRSTGIAVTGSIATNGTLTLTGASTDSFNMTTALQQWQTIASGSNMSGTYVVALTSRSGEVIVQDLRVQETLLDMTKS